MEGAVLSFLIFFFFFFLDYSLRRVRFVWRWRYSDFQCAFKPPVIEKKCPLRVNPPGGRMSHKVTHTKKRKKKTKKKKKNSLRDERLSIFLKNFSHFSVSRLRCQFGWSPERSDVASARLTLMAEQVGKRGVSASIPKKPKQSSSLRFSWDLA